MCGIAGIVTRELTGRIDKSVLDDMTRAIAHRGPDGHGTWIDRNAGLGSRRLRIIDVDGGDMPIHNEDGSCTIVYNGEVYNFPELRAECEARGHIFKTRTDTETILHLYEDYGPACVNRLNGMFAFAIYDRRDRSLFVARDRLGIKPLYYADTLGSLVFGSEIKALLKHPEVSRDIDPTAVDLYLRKRYIPAPRTIYRQIRKLPAAHTLAMKDSEVSITPYWSLDYDDTGPKDLDEAADGLRDRLRASVERQMISDVPLGAFLSGGVDSSTIVALMSELSDRPIKTFAIGFEEQSYNELTHARTVAERFGTDHHELVVRPDAVDLARTVLTHFDEPFGDSSALPTYLVSKLAREHVTVALSGTGADELFAGYERYWAIPIAQAFNRLPRSARRVLRGTLDALPSGHAKRNLVHRARSFVRSTDLDLFDRHLQLQQSFPTPYADTLYAPAFTDELGTGNVDLPGSRASSDLARLLDLDTRTTLVDDYLVKDDRSSMAVSLELRVPFLDHTVVEYAASLPDALKLRGLKTKRVLKHAYRHVLPESITRRPKHGFELPIARWLSDDLSTLVQDTVLNEAASIRRFVSAEVVQGLYTRHKSGYENNSRLLWSLLGLELWLQQSGDVS